MTNERKEELLEKIKKDEITYDDFNSAEDFLFIFDNGYKFKDWMIGDIIYDLGDVYGEIVKEEIIDIRRWNTYKEIILRFKDRFFKFGVDEGNTEQQETYYDENIVEVIETKQGFIEKENTEIEVQTSLIELPKMEFVFDNSKISPAKIDKNMIDFEKAEKDVEEIEKLYDVVFDDIATVKKYREEVATKKSNADKFKKDLMDYLTADTKEINQKLIDLIKRVDAVRKYLHEKEKEMDNVKREKIKSIKELVFKDRPEYLAYLIENKKWENKTFKEANIEAEIQQQYDELIKKENFIKQEIEKANKEIKFKILFENVKFLIKEEYTTISETITNNMNETKQTEENLRKLAEEKVEKEKQQEIEALKEQQEKEKQEAVAKAIQEKPKETDVSEKTDTYICIKVNGLTKEATNDLLEIIKKHNLKYLKEMR